MLDDFWFRLPRLGAKEDDTDTSEFIRRFALHFCPKRFLEFTFGLRCEIRHYGFEQYPKTGQDLETAKLKLLQEKLKVKVLEKKKLCP
jgi:hypothetical protein